MWFRRTSTSWLQRVLLMRGDPHNEPMATRGHRLISKLADQFARAIVRRGTESDLRGGEPPDRGVTRIDDSSTAVATEQSCTSEESTRTGGEAASSGAGQQVRGIRTLGQWALQWVRKETTLTSLTIIGLVFYSIVRFNLQVYYAAFGVTLEDVGLSYADTIGLAAVALLLVGLQFGALFGILAIVLWIGAGWALLGLIRVVDWALARAYFFLLFTLPRRHESRSDFLYTATRTRWAILTAAAGMYLALIIDAAYLKPPLNYYPSPPVAIAMATAMAFVMFSFLRATGGAVFSRDELNLKEITPRSLRILLRMLAAVVVPLSLIWMTRSAYLAGHQLASGNYNATVLPHVVNEKVGSPFRADLIELEPVGPVSTTSIAKGCAVYLGEDDSVMVITQAGRTYRIYSGNIVIRSHGPTDHCSQLAQ